MNRHLMLLASSHTSILLLAFPSRLVQPFASFVATQRLLPSKKKRTIPFRFFNRPMSTSRFLNHQDESCPLANLGDRLSDVDTPALILDMDAFEGNLRTMKDWVNEHNSQQKREGRKLMLRPHAKTHKTPEVALRQINEGGAVGVCVQKLDEAAAMIEGGVRDILITNQIVGKKKLLRLLSLASHSSEPNLSILVDDVQNVHDIASELESQSIDLQIGVLIEINGGQDRCGVSCDDEMEIMRIFNAVQMHAPRLVFKGIHCYGGSLQHIRSKTTRRERVMNEPVAAAAKARDILSRHKAPCEVVTGGGTGTFPFEAIGGVHNEIQPGSYVFMDVDYGGNEEGNSMFSSAVFVHTTVVSTAVMAGERSVVDAGTKAVSLDSGPPGVADTDTDFGLTNVVDENIVYESGGDEHGILLHRNKDGGYKAGDTIRLIPGHIDPTVNMHDFFVCVRKQPDGTEPIVVATWKIRGRGPGM